jgi:SAM-dependent methyltransferase
LSELKTAADWLARYDAHNTPWDRGSAHPELVARIESGVMAPPRAGARALVPGAGRGHDAVVLARAGWSVTAVDFVEDLAVDASRALAPFGGTFVAADALEFTGEGFDLIWEHTFFCAIDPAQRASWGAMVRRNLVPGGRLEALVFPADKPMETGGPPFGYGICELLVALGKGFSLEQESALESRLEGRDWLELLASFRLAKG